MLRKITKISILALTLIMAETALVFFFYPSLFVNFYIGKDEVSVWAKAKYLPFEKEISGTDSYKAPDLQWSPDKMHLAFYDFIREEIYNKEWALKIINPRILQVKTIFIGDWRTSEFKWMDNDTVRAYVSAGSGVRIYRDIDINIDSLFIAADHESLAYWVPEKTFVSQ